MAVDAASLTTAYAAFGPSARFHHVGLAVTSVREADPAAKPIVNRTEGVTMAFIDVHGVTVELLEPLGDESPIARSLEAGVKLLHLCFEVDDLDEALAAGRAAGFHRVSTPVVVPEWGGRRIAWTMSRVFGLVELAERPSTP